MGARRFDVEKDERLIEHYKQSRKHPGHGNTRKDTETVGES
jgi:hypothetical protein